MGSLSRSSELPAFQSPRSAIGELASAVAGAAVSVLCLSRVSPLLSSGCDDNRWMWGLGAMVLIAAPTSAGQLVKLARAALERRR